MQLENKAKFSLNYLGLLALIVCNERALGIAKYQSEMTEPIIIEQIYISNKLPRPLRSIWQLENIFFKALQNWYQVPHFLYRNRGLRGP